MQLLERGDQEKKEQYLQVIHGQTDQLMRLVEDILSFSELAVEKTGFTPVNINRLVEQAVVVHKLRAEAAGVELDFDARSAIPLVQASPRQLGQLMTELVENAITYTQKGRVRINTYLSPDGAHACVQVQDTGRGIESEDLPHVFERFYRGRGVGSSNIPGTGMGLSIAQEIAEMHGCF